MNIENETIDQTREQLAADDTLNNHSNDDNTNIKEVEERYFSPKTPPMDEDQTTSFPPTSTPSTSSTSSSSSSSLLTIEPSIETSSAPSTSSASSSTIEPVVQEMPMIQNETELSKIQDDSTATSFDGQFYNATAITTNNISGSDQIDTTNQSVTVESSLQSITKKAETITQQHQNASKKRKSPVMLINLLKFVTTMQNIYDDVHYHNGRFTIPRFMSYINNNDEEHGNAKKSKSSHVTYTDTAAVAIATVTDNEKATAKKSLTKEMEALKLKYSEALYRNILIGLFLSYEKLGVTFQFSKELFKYFLATHSRFLTHRDFVTNNLLVEKRKNVQQLSAGGILAEYIKGLDVFKNNIAKSDKDDIVAIKLIIEHKISISPKTYNILRKAKHIENKYKFINGNSTMATSTTATTTMTMTTTAIRGIDNEESRKTSNWNNGNTANDKDINWHEYACININSFKRIQLLISKFIVLVKDESQNQYVLPSVNIEKDITATLISECKFDNDEYAIFDVLLGSKNKIIDILYTNIDNCILSDAYKDRLNFIMNRFPNLKCVQVYTNNSNNFESNCILKPLMGKNQTAYIYIKPSLTAAVVGTMDNYACLAFMINEKELGIRAKYNISGPTTCLITTAEYQDGSNQNLMQNKTILYNGKPFILSGELNDNIKLFKEVISVEIKDGHKLGNFSERPVSFEHEYKQTIHTAKEATINDSFMDLLQDPKTAEDFITKLATTPIFDKILYMIDKAKPKNLVLDYGKYDN